MSSSNVSFQEASLEWPLAGQPQDLSPEDAGLGGQVLGGTPRPVCVGDGKFFVVCPQHDSAQFLSVSSGLVGVVGAL